MTSKPHPIAAAMVAAQRLLTTDELPETSAVQKWHQAA
jgi:hypothetical protein